MTLEKMVPGTKAVICSLPAGRVQAQIIRFGLCRGAEVKCVEVIPGGPVILEHKKQEIAIGRRLAMKIEVTTIPAAAKRNSTGGVA